MPNFKLRGTFRCRGFTCMNMLMWCKIQSKRELHLANFPITQQGILIDLIVFLLYPGISLTRFMFWLYEFSCKDHFLIYFRSHGNKRMSRQGFQFKLCTKHNLKHTPGRQTFETNASCRANISYMGQLPTSIEVKRKLF